MERPCLRTRVERKDSDVDQRRGRTSSVCLLELLGQMLSGGLPGQTQCVDQWNADQYLKFQQERSQPVYDLMDFIGPRRDMRIVDLGCGTGEHTRTLHGGLRDRDGRLDTSDDMLAKTPRLRGLKFFKADIAEFGGDSSSDLLFSNAALHCVGSREAVRPVSQGHSPGELANVGSQERGSSEPADCLHAGEAGPIQQLLSSNPLGAGTRSRPSNTVC